MLLPVGFAKQQKNCAAKYRWQELRERGEARGIGGLGANSWSMRHGKSWVAGKFWQKSRRRKCQSGLGTFQSIQAQDSPVQRQPLIKSPR